MNPLSGNPFPAGNQPSAIVVDPNYPFVYVTNALDSTVWAYSMNSGELTNVGTYGTGLEPVAMGIDPSTSHFLYIANFLGNTAFGTVSGFELSPTAGTLINSENSPYIDKRPADSRRRHSAQRLRRRHSEVRTGDPEH